MRKIIYITYIWLSIIVLSIIVNSCCSDNDSHFEWENITLVYLKKDNNGYNMSNDNQFIYKEFGIQLLLNGKIVAIMNPNLSLIQSANAAYDCYISYSPKYKITEIQVQTLSIYDLNHPKNSNIASYFKILRDDGTLTNIGDFLVDENKINGSTLDESSFYDPINMFLQVPPGDDFESRFVIKVKLDNGTIISDTTKTIKMLK